MKNKFISFFFFAQILVFTKNESLFPFTYFSMEQSVFMYYSFTFHGIYRNLKIFYNFTKLGEKRRQSSISQYLFNKPNIFQCQNDHKLSSKKLDTKVWS